MNCKKIISFILILFSFSVFNAQNLVPNPSFEDTLACPTQVNQMNNALGWVSSRNSPDYINACSANQYVGVPSNWFGYQYASTGNAYCGASAFNKSTSNPNQREIVGRSLSSPLIIGTKYYVSMKVNRSSYTPLASNNLGMLFSTVPYSVTSPAPINNFAHFNYDTIITDTLNWKKLSGSFIADSAYTFISLGNFFDDNNTDTLRVMPGYHTSVFAYYYIDDIYVSTDSVVGVEEQVTLAKINIYPNPTSGAISINLNEPKSGALRVLNSLGQIVFEEAFKATRELKIALDGPSGLYFVQLEIDGELITKKVVKE